MKRQAFTLIELAVVLTIVGLVIGGSFKALKYSRERAYVEEAKEHVNSSIDAIIRDSLLFEGLPTIEHFDQNLSTERILILSSGLVKKAMLYIPDNGLIGIDVCSKTTTNLSIIDEISTPNRTISNVAFIVAHESANKNLQTGLQSNNVHIYSPSENEDDNKSSPNINREEAYDDIVKWVTLSELQQNIDCNSKPFKFLNDRLPHGNVGNSYSATMYVDNNISNVNIKCTGNFSDFNLSFSETYSKFNGDLNNTGTALVECNATETSGELRLTTKKFVLTIDP